MASVLETQPLLGSALSVPAAALPSVLVNAATVITEGYDLSVIGGVLVLIREDLQLTPWQEGWLIGVQFFMMALGAPISGYIGDALGRKKALAMIFVLLTAGPLTMALSAGFKSFIVGRILLGLGIGGGVNIVSAYLAEVSPADVRGRLVGLEELFFVLGGILGSLSNFYLVDLPRSWRWMLGVGALPPLLLLCVLASPLVLESPRWLLLQGRMEEAKAVLNKLLKPAEVRQALDEWAHQASQHVEPWINVVRPADARKRDALLSGIVVSIMNTGCGITIITVYLATFLEEQSELGDEHGLGYLVGFNTLRAITVVLTLTFISDRWGRRDMLLFSSVGIIIAMAILMTAYSTGAAFLPYKLLGLGAVAVAHPIGLGSAAWPYISEVCSNDVRSKSISFMIFCARIFSGFATMSVPTLLRTIDIAGLFACLLVFNFFGLFAMYYCVQETRGKSLEAMGVVVDKVDGKI
mmetsp:Transcript_46090/g.100104  ORF Transcript_46090/g.100104 Transcript_46090/m.100104 type:complete len:467 (-) Transcript_46090:136-1536(-)